MQITPHITPHIIARQISLKGPLQVTAECLHLIWPNSADSLSLHRVQIYGLRHITQRALAIPNSAMLLFDLARLLPTIAHELRQTPARDIDGFVFFTLRQAYRDAAQFAADVERHATGTWWPTIDGQAYTWHPAARAIDPAVAAVARPDVMPRNTTPKWAGA